MLLLCGATGQLGGRIAAHVLERGVPVRALVRPGADAAGLEGAEIVRGDFRDAASLEPAVQGVDTVVSGVTAIARMLGGREGRDGLRAVDHEGHLRVIDAAERSGIGRFVFVSAAGIDTIPRSPLGRAKLAVEERLRRSPMREVIVRPDAFQEVWLSPLVGFDVEGGTLTIYGTGEGRTRYVAVDDVAAAVAALATREDPPSRVDFGGPELLSRNDVADRIEHAAGRPLKRKHVPRAALAVGSRALAPLKPELASVMALSLMLDTGSVGWDDGPLRELGIDPRPTSTYIDEAAGR